MRASQILIITIIVFVALFILYPYLLLDDETIP